jgi:hypothetical protein
MELGQVLAGRGVRFEHPDPRVVKETIAVAELVDHGGFVRLEGMVGPEAVGIKRRGINEYGSHLGCSFVAPGLSTRIAAVV